MLDTNLLYKKKSAIPNDFVFGMDFENGFTDTSAHGWPVTNTGVTLASTPVLSGAQNAVFSKTVVTPATTYLRTDTSAWGVNPFVDDWTIEYYFYNLTQGNFGQSVFFTLGNHNALGYALYVTGRYQKLGLFWSNGQNDIHNSITADPATFNLNTKYHAAIVKKGKVFTIYKNGAQVSTATLDTSAWTLNSSILTIGCISETANGSTTEFPWIGNLDNFRYYNYARYSSNFTPDP
uniref:Concanavalin A-like lectin/glucanase superfamily protein n=1 Tax=Burkholderia phage vB_BgluM-SURPRISE13 TaxID=3159457 RepID=A0AAU7PGL2_9VIRU